MQRRVLSGITGAIVGLTLWLVLAPAYAVVPATIAKVLTPHLFDPGYRFEPVGDTAIFRRPDNSVAATLFVKLLTFNLITLVALFALARRPLGGRNLGRLAIAVAIMAVVHALALLLVAKSFVVGADESLSAGLWRVAAQGYTIIGSQAIAFALWWALRVTDEPEGAAEPARLRKAARRR